MFFLLLVSGCAIYHPKPISSAQTAAQLESRRLDDPGLKKFIDQNLGHERPETWDLSTLTLAAFYFQPGLEVARAQWQAAEAGVRTAGARPNPTISVTPGYNTTTTIPTPWMPAATFDLPVETMGKRGKRVAAARQAAVSARYDFITTAWNVRRDLRAGLLEFVVAGKRAEWLQRQFTAQRQVVALLQQRFEAGAISRPELTTAQIALNRLQLDLSDARSKQVASRMQLAQTIGVSASALDGMSPAFDLSQAAPAGLTSADTRKLALLSRSDLLAALADYASAEDELHLEIAKQYPDLHLSPGYQYDQGDNKWSVGLTLELPLLDRNRGPIAAAEAKRKVAAAKFVERQLQVINDVDRAVADYQVAEEQLKTADALYAAGELQQRFAAAQLKAGAADALDAQNAEMEFASASLTRLESQARFQAALGALEDALQRPADSIAATIDRISKTSKAKDK